MAVAVESCQKIEKTTMSSRLPLVIKWRTCFPEDSETWIDSPEYNLLGWKNLEFQFVVSIERVKDPESLNIEVQKKTSMSMRGEVHLSINSKNYGAEKMDDWRNEICLFPNLELFQPTNETTKEYDIIVTLHNFRPVIKKSDFVVNTANFYLNDDLSDANLIVGREMFPVHIFLLSIRSPVFKSSFLEQLRANSGRRFGSHVNVVMKHVDASVMKIILKFIYTDDISDLNDVEDTMKVLRAAHMLQITDLKKTCAEKLKHRLAADNFLKMFELADLYHSTELRDRLIQFFKSKITMLSSSRSFIRQMNEFCDEQPHLASEINEIMQKKIKENEKATESS